MAIRYAFLLYENKALVCLIIDSGDFNYQECVSLWLCAIAKL